MPCLLILTRNVFPAIFNSRTRLFWKKTSVLGKRNMTDEEIKQFRDDYPDAAIASVAALEANTQANEEFCGEEVHVAITELRIRNLPLPWERGNLS